MRLSEAWELLFIILLPASDGVEIGEDLKIFTFSRRKSVSFDGRVASSLSEVYVWSFERGCMSCRFDVLGWQLHCSPGVLFYSVRTWHRALVSYLSSRYGGDFGVRRYFLQYLIALHFLFSFFFPHRAISDRRGRDFWQGSKCFFLTILDIRHST